MALIFVFVDGIGLGKNNGENPFVTREYESFGHLALGQPFTEEAENRYHGDRLFRSIDACLGIEGLPQSGTGQVTLFSGINTAKVLGRHFGPYPHSEIRDYLAGTSLFQKFQRENGRIHFINAFPEVFFESSRRKNRWSSTTLMTRKAGVPLNSVSEVLQQRAITAELNQSVWKSRFSPDIPVITEQEAAGRLLTVAGNYDLVLMEYYLTDKAGHDRDPEQARDVLRRLDRFLLHLITNTQKNGHTLLVTSDHGNLEDLAVKTHTRNNVPFFVTGDNLKPFFGVRSIQDVTPSCVTWYRSTFGKG